MRRARPASSTADTLLTPYFRILIGGPSAADVKVRLGDHGDTCVDNAGANAPYVVVTSVFDGGVYRVQPGQRVMFENGSLHEVVDEEKEPCGCPATQSCGKRISPGAERRTYIRFEPAAGARSQAARGK